MVPGSENQGRALHGWGGYLMAWLCSGRADVRGAPVVHGKDRRLGRGSRNRLMTSCAHTRTGMADGYGDIPANQIQFMPVISAILKNLVQGMPHMTATSILDP